jgi:hypothetical protein
MLELTGFHGTQESFEEFKLPAWFSNTAAYAREFSGEWGHKGELTDDSRVITVSLTFHNPYHTDNWCITEPIGPTANIMAELQAKGHDGVVFTNPDNPAEQEFIALISTVYEVKSTQLEGKAVVLA